MIYLQLFIVFAKIGLFSFGGGLAMLPLIQREVVNYGWLTVEEFLKVVSISQATPGPIAINSATFVGNKAAGVFGAMVATLGVTLPSFMIMMFISAFLLRVADSPLKIDIFKGIKAVTISFILFAVYTIGTKTYVVEGQVVYLPMFFSLGAFVMAKKTKMHPIAIIAIFGALGYFLL